MRRGGGSGSIRPTVGERIKMATSGKRYSVDLVADDVARLREKLDKIADEGGHVVSIMWQPSRGGPNHLMIDAGYVLVAVYTTEPIELSSKRR